ncbi:MAG: extracellular solute-binding protein, partial [Oscillospiraceae bacterium]|nr:extracellular solute-binding protein [Oscillospiraceae bacterium]
MKRFTARLLIAVCLLPSALFCGCGKANSHTTATPITLKVWGSQEDQAMLREMCDSFAATNSDRQYKFEFGVVGEGEAKQIILDDPDAAADVFHFSDDQLRDLVEAGVLAQIGGTYRERTESECGRGAVEAATADGKLYAFPATADNGYFLYYNKAVFPEAPNTLDEILAACTDGRHFAMKLSDSWYLASFFLTAGCTFQEDGTVDWDSEAGLSAARAVLTLSTDPRFVNFGADYDASILSGFGDGSVIAAVSGTWNAAAIAAEIGEENVGAAKLPMIRLDGEMVQMRGFAGYKLIGVNAASEEAEEAVRLAAWLTSEENQLKRFRERAMGPANKNAAASE